MGGDDGIVDDGVHQRFVLVQEGVEAELVYRLLPGRLVLIHTGVPDALSGQGIGGRLVRAAVARARAEGLTLVPYCPFAARWLRGHPGEVADVPIDWPAGDIAEDLDYG